MFNFLKKLIAPSEELTTVTGVDPQTENEFMFYEFVSTTPSYLLEAWMNKAKEVGYKFKAKYEFAISQKLSTGNFENPHKFPEYFSSTFDYIAIDFETANNNRISACAIGLSFVKNNIVVHSDKHYILPPSNEKFLKSHTEIHGIKRTDLEYAMNFKELWEYEFKKYFNNNLVVFHNASMDLSILKNSFEYYEIKPFSVSYIDTMLFAEKLGYPKKFVDLAKTLNIEIKKHHDPKDDAEVCALIFGKLISKYPNYKELIRTLTSDEKATKSYFNEAPPQILSENTKHINNYAISQEELESLSIATKGIVVTGNFDIERDIITDFFMRQGGQIKSGITTKVDYVIAGEECGWSKIQKVNELNNSKKATIKILSSNDLKYLMKKYSVENTQ